MTSSWTDKTWWTARRQPAKSRASGCVRSSAARLDGRHKLSTAAAKRLKASARWLEGSPALGHGCPTFLNFGKDYAGALDDWVHVYSPDAESAYQPADRMVLARVPKGKITQRAAYEFFRGLDDKQQPRWSNEIASRGAVFEHQGRCYRPGVTFNAGLKRYLWVQVMPGTEGKEGRHLL